MAENRKNQREDIYKDIDELGKRMDELRAMGIDTSSREDSQNPTEVPSQEKKSPFQRLRDALMKRKPLDVTNPPISEAEDKQVETPVLTKQTESEQSDTEQANLYADLESKLDGLELQIHQIINPEKTDFDEDYITKNGNHYKINDKGKVKAGELAKTITDKLANEDTHAVLDALELLKKRPEIHYSKDNIQGHLYRILLGSIKNRFPATGEELKEKQVLKESAIVDEPEVNTPEEDKVELDKPDELDKLNVEMDMKKPVEAFKNAEDKLDELSLKIHKLITNEHNPFSDALFDIRKSGQVKINDEGKAEAKKITDMIAEEMPEQVNGDMIKSLRELQKLFHFNNVVKKGAGVIEGENRQADMYRVFVTSIISRMDKVVSKKESEQSGETEKSPEKAEQQGGRRKKFINRLRRAFVIGGAALSLMLGIGDRANETNVDTNTGNEAGANTLVVEAAEEVETDDSNNVIRLTVPQREVEPEITSEPTSETRNETPVNDVNEIKRIVKDRIGEVSDNFAETMVSRIVNINNNPETTVAEVQDVADAVNIIFPHGYPGTDRDRTQSQQASINAMEFGNPEAIIEIADSIEESGAELLSPNQADVAFLAEVGLSGGENGDDFALAFFQASVPPNEDITQDDVQRYAEAYQTIFPNGIPIPGERTDNQQDVFNIMYSTGNYQNSHNGITRGQALNNVINGLLGS